MGLFCHKWHISELSTVRYWKWNYWLICPDLFTHAFSPSVNWKFGQDRFQNKSLSHFCPVHCLSLIFREWIQNYSRNFAACTCPKLSLKHNSSKSIAISQSSVIIKLSKRHNESLIYITSALMRWFTSVQNSGAFSGEWILKNCNVSDWPLHWRNQNMSLIGYIAQRCKNTLDSLLNLLSAFAFVWGYLNS